MSFSKAADPPTNTSEAEKLAQEISSKTQDFIAVLRKNGNAIPSYDVTSTENLPTDGMALQTSLMELTSELQFLIQGPRLYLHNQILAHVNLINLHAMYKFQLPRLVPMKGSISYQELGRLSGVSEDNIRRIARYAITKHMFHEVDGERLVHSSTSRMLAESPMMMEWIGMVCEEMWPAATQAIPSLLKWPNSEEPQHSGFALAHGLDTHVFDMLVNQPKRASRFANAMVYFNSNEDLAPHHLYSAFDWTDVKQFVDIGGSAGSTAVELASRLPEMEIVIQDQAVLEEQAKRSIPPELTRRVRFMSHNFFESQPVLGADVYHFRWIFHDWPDKFCLQLLRALIPALRTGARIIISDFVVPASGTTSRFQEGLVRGFDLAMMELFNAKERERKDWDELFSQADSRLHFEGVNTVAGANLAFISAVWQGNGDCADAAVRAEPSTSGIR